MDVFPLRKDTGYSLKLVWCNCSHNSDVFIVSDTPQNHPDFTLFSLFFCLMKFKSCFSLKVFCFFIVTGGFFCFYRWIINWINVIRRHTDCVCEPICSYIYMFEGVDKKSPQKTDVFIQQRDRKHTYAKAGFFPLKSTSSFISLLN